MSTQATCHGIDRAFQPDLVNVGWGPWRVTENAAIWTKPGCGKVLDIVPRLGGVARQSVRNPTLLPVPSYRSAVIGLDGEAYVWVYKRHGAKTGWILQRLLEFDPDAWKKNPCKGPAGEDYELGREAPERGKRTGCGKISLSKPLMVVKSRELAFRYAAHSTTFHYAHEGDVLRVLIVDGPQGFHFGEVEIAAPDGSLHRGVRGWFASSGVRRLA